MTNTTTERCPVHEDPASVGEPCEECWKDIDGDAVLLCEECDYPRTPDHPCADCRYFFDL